MRDESEVKLEGVHGLVPFDTDSRRGGVVWQELIQICAEYNLCIRLGSSALQNGGSGSEYQIDDASTEHTTSTLHLSLSPRTHDVKAYS